MSFLGKFFKPVTNLVGGLIGGLVDKNSAKQAASQQFDYQRELQQQNIDWEREQYQNKNQWTVEDMRKAGLNPILAAGNTGSVASAPGGSVSLADTRMDLAGKISQLQTNSAERYNLRTSALSAAKTADANEKNALSNEKRLTIDSKVADANVRKLDNDVAVNAANSAAYIKKLENDIANSSLVSSALAGYYHSAGDAAVEQARIAGLNANTNSAHVRGLLEKYNKEAQSIEQQIKIHRPDADKSDQLHHFYNNAGSSMGFWNYVGHVTRNLLGFARF